MSMDRKGALRNYRRDPIEHGLWRSWFVEIMNWNSRPYNSELASLLSMAASTFLYHAQHPAPNEQELKKWKAAQLSYIGDIEIYSHGAISNHLKSAALFDQAALVEKVAQSRRKFHEGKKQQQASLRSEMKRLLSESGLQTLLDEERYVPSVHGEGLKSVPFKLDIPQTNLFVSTPLQIKTLYAPVHVHDGVRILVDMFPPRISVKRAGPIDYRGFALLPTRRLFDWYGQNPERWDEFQRFHHQQLNGGPPRLISFLKQMIGGPVTLMHLDRDQGSVALSFKNYLLNNFGEHFSEA